jgi:endonuclease G, mitochondrial
VAIRNNLVTEANENELRYFAGTLSGSSGSPVFDDNWNVVALHSSCRYVENVRFQGRPAAWINRGIQMAAVLKDLRARFPKIAAELDRGAHPSGSSSP